MTRRECRKTLRIWQAWNHDKATEDRRGVLKLRIQTQEVIVNEI